MEASSNACGTSCTTLALFLRRPRDDERSRRPSVSTSERPRHKVAERADGGGRGVGRDLVLSKTQHLHRWRVRRPLYLPPVSHTNIKAQRPARL